MTKLTKEQIEQERKAFEKWYSEKFKTKSFRRINSTGDYARCWQQDIFIGWLARAEMARGE